MFVTSFAQLEVCLWIMLFPSGWNCKSVLFAHWPTIYIVWYFWITSYSLGSEPFYSVTSKTWILNCRVYWTRSYPESTLEAAQSESPQLFAGFHRQGYVFFLFKCFNTFSFLIICFEFILKKRSLNLWWKFTLMWKSSICTTEITATLS